MKKIRPIRRAVVHQKRRSTAPLMSLIAKIGCVFSIHDWEHIKEWTWTCKNCSKTEA